MAELTIITDHKWKQLKYANEVPIKILNDQFDWMDKAADGLPEDYFDGFIKYRGTWYHTEDFMRLGKNSPFNDKWHGYASDSFFSGVLIELSDCGEGYRIGMYIFINGGLKNG